MEDISYKDFIALILLVIFILILAITITQNKEAKDYMNCERGHEELLIDNKIFICDEYKSKS